MESSVGTWAAFLAGVLSFLSPCVLPLVPAYLAFLAGGSWEWGEPQDPRGRVRIFFRATAFVLGFSAVFIALGATASAIGGWFSSYQVWIQRLGGAVVIVLGIFLLGLLPVSFLQRDLRLRLKSPPAGLAGSGLVGAAFAAGWTPCVGPVLASVLLYASASRTLSSGIFLLSVYSLGLALPFLIASLALGRFLTVLRRARPILRWMEPLLGALLVFFGGLLLLGGMNRFTAWMLMQFSGWVRFLTELGI
ncbi:MAG: sulfite exporter TauE/SafE family protein [Elusimicrobia bacterium]|nr:sulfite exporter TauE/SafE family protein [Elusimicrobiota bacterium]